MSSISTEKTHTARSFTQTMLDVFLSLKSGLRSVHGSPRNSNGGDKVEKGSPTGSSRFKTFASSGENLRKHQLQSAKRKMRVRAQMASASENSAPDEYHYDRETQPLNYETMVKQRIGVKGPVITYQIPKMRPYSVCQEDYSSTAETMLTSYCRSLVPLDTRDIQIISEYDKRCAIDLVTHVEVELFEEALKNWCSSPTLIPRRLGIRALTFGGFRYTYRCLESEVVKFLLTSQEIRENISSQCRKAHEKLIVTSDFLQHTQFSALVHGAIEKDMLSIEELIKSEDFSISSNELRLLRQKYQDTTQINDNIPRFFETMSQKRTAAESRLYELSQFFTQVGNHIRNAETIDQSFVSIQSTHGTHEYLFQEYIIKLWLHFDESKRHFLGVVRTKLFDKFITTLENCKKDNYEAHQMMNSIASRRVEVLRSGMYIKRRLLYLQKK